MLSQEVVLFDRFIFSLLTCCECCWRLLTGWLKMQEWKIREWKYRHETEGECSGGKCCCEQRSHPYFTRILGVIAIPRNAHRASHGQNRSIFAKVITKTRHNVGAECRHDMRPSPRLSFCPSVPPSMTLMFRGHISWLSLKVITRLISLGF